MKYVTEKITDWVLLAGISIILFIAWLWLSDKDTDTDDDEDQILPGV